METIRHKTEIKIKNKFGMHLRPVAQFVQTALRYKCSVQVEGGGRKVDGKSMLGMVKVAMPQGNTITVEAEGEDARECLRALSDLADSYFGDKE